MDQALYDDSGQPIVPKGPPGASTLYDDDGQVIAPPKPTTMGDRVEGLARLVDTLVPHDPNQTGQGAAQRIVQWGRNPGNRVAQGAMVGAPIGAELGAMGGPVGAGVGGVLGAALGGAGGALSRGDKPADAAVSGLKEGAFQAPFAMLPGVAPALESGAVKMWSKAAKPTIAALKTTNTFRGGGTLSAAEEEVARTVLNAGAGRISPANAQKMRTVLDGLDDKLDDVLKSSSGVVQRQDLQAELAAAYQQIAAGTAAGESMRRGLVDAYQLLQQQPDTIPIQIAQKMKRDIYRLGHYAIDAKSAGLAAAEKVKGGALRTAIADAEPAAKDLNADMSRMIPATRVVDEAALRAGKRDTFSLPEIVSAGQALSSGSPRALAATGASIFNRPGVTSGAAQSLYDLANRFKTVGPSAVTPRAIREALLQMFQGGQ